MRASASSLLLAALIAACAGHAPAYSVAADPESPARGAPGDTVRVIINHVSQEKRAQFEHFARDILMPAMVKVAPEDPATAKQMRRARLLYPTAMDHDSTFAYVFIVDPVVTSRSYSFPNLLTKAYGSERATEYMKLFRESLARGQDTWLETNAAW